MYSLPVTLVIVERILVAMALVAAVFGASDEQSIRSGPVYTSLTVFPEVRVLVAVPLTAKPVDLKPGAFSLRVDAGAPTPATLVQPLSDTGLGMAAAVVMDAKDSMASGPLNAIRAGLVKFTSEATLGDRVAICTIADDTRCDSNWNDTPDQVKAALAKLAPRGKATRLWDGLIDVMAKFPDTPLARRLVFISDGGDDGSQHSLDEVIATATRQQVAVDCVGIPRGDGKPLANLERLSAATKGGYHIASSFTVLEQLVGGGTRRYRTLPVVTFRPEGVAMDGKPHTFEVSWKAAGVEHQSSIEALVPDDVKAPAPIEVPEVKPVQPPVDTPMPAAAASKMWLYVVGGIATALLLSAIAFFMLHKPAPEPTPQPAAPSAPPVDMAPRGSVYMALPVLFPPPGKLNPSAWLVGTEGAVNGKLFPIDEPQYWIGAGLNNQLVLPDDPTISGNHACIMYENDHLVLYDHRSTNGTIVNDERLTELRRVLQPGDRIRIGRSTFVLRPHDAA